MDRQPPPLETWPSSAKRFALVIGVDEYQDTQINKLDGATNDAKALADALVRYAGFPMDQIILLTSDQSVERKPTRGNILRRLSNLRAVVPKDGLLLVSFAGHGMERDGRAFLLPCDAQVSGDLALLEETAINAEVIRSWIRQTGVGQVMIIIDACRNNPGAGRGGGENPMTEAYTRGFNFDLRNREIVAFVTLYSTEVGHVAYENKEKRQGYFTWALVEGLKGSAANGNGEVTLAGLLTYLQEKVPKQVFVDLGPDSKQRPFAVVEGYKADELVLSTIRHPSVDVKATAPANDGVKQEENTDSTSNSSMTGSDNYESLLRSGTAAFKSRKWEQAIPYFQKASRMAPEKPEIWNWLGRAYLAVGHYDEARAMWAKSLQLGANLSFNVCREGGLSCNTGELQVGPTKVSFVEAKGKEIFSASPSQVIVRGVEKSSITFTKHSVSRLKITVDSKGYTFDYVPDSVYGCEHTGFYHCPVPGFTQQDVVSNFIVQTILGFTTKK